MKSAIAMVLTLCVLSAARADLCEQMFKKCAFRIGYRKSVPTFELMRKPSQAFTPRIRSRWGPKFIGNLQSNGRGARFILFNRAVSVTKFGSPPYSKHHFKPVELEFGGSAIAHEAFRRNNFVLAKDRCIIVSFSSYSVLNRDGSIKKTINKVPRDSNKCVVFKTK